MIQLLRKRKGTAATRDPSRVEDETPAALLELGLSTYERKIHARLLARIASGLPKKRRVRVLASKSDRHDELRLLALRWLRHLEHLVGETRERLYQLRRREAEFNIALAKASSDEDRNQVVLAFGADFARSRADAARDRRALSRWLGPDAIKDRFTRRLCEAERDLAFYLGRLGALAAFVIGQTPDPAEKRAVWSRIGLEALIKPLLAHDGDVRVVTAAFRALARALTALPSSDRETCVDEATLQYIYRSALQSRQDVWVQAEAIALLGELSIESASRVLEERLARDHGGDDFFVRRRAVKTLIALAPRLPKLSDLVNVVLSDPSPFVRQALAEAIHFLPRSIASRVLLSLAFRDPDPKVRAAAVWEIRKVAEPQNAELLQTALECLVEVLAKETDSFVLRTATRAAVESTQALRERSSEVLATWGTACYRALDLLHASEHPIPVRRQAAQAREAVWCALRDDAWNVLAYWRSVVGSMNEGGARVLSARPLRGVDHDLLGRALSVQTQNDFGLDVRTGRLWSQVQYGFR
ncbi:MAG TPA: HEAT repeat domain-containing protein, partial [Planctomycetota bacterium]|nr:HEAT repeat domain-containing protein [Planctomycetota bacterium]